MRKPSRSLKSAFLSSRRARRLVSGLLPETAVLNLDGGFRLAVDARDMTGPSYYVMNDGAEAFYHYELAEKSEMLLGCRSAAPVLIDIGANIGLFTFFLKRALPASRVLAFEPMPHLAACVRKTAELNRLTGVEVREMALSDREGEAEFFVHRSNSGGHGLRKEELGTGNVARSLRVKLESLDRVLATAPLSALDVMKIDVQGNETSVLEGAVETLKRHRPRLIVEVDRDALHGEFDWFSRFFSANALPYRHWRHVASAESRAIEALAAELRHSSSGQLNLVFLAD